MTTSPALLRADGQRVRDLQAVGHGAQRERGWRRGGAAAAVAMAAP
jgi:hypothetical protein